MPALTLLLVAQDSAPLLRRTLASYVRQLPEDAELLVVDAGSCDDTQTVLSQMAQAVRLKVISREDRSTVAAWNAGLAAASGALIVLMASDQLIGSNFVRGHLRSTPTPEVRVGSVRGVLLRPELHASFEDESQRVLQKVGAAAIEALRQRLERGDSVESNPLGDALSQASYSHRSFLMDAEALASRTDHPLQWALGVSGNIALPRQALRQMGGFDEATFQQPLVARLDLLFRLYQRGVRFRSDLECVAYQQDARPSPPPALFASEMTRLADKHHTLATSLLFPVARERISLDDAGELLEEAAQCQARGQHQVPDELERTFRRAIAVFTASRTY